MPLKKTKVGKANIGKDSQQLRVSMNLGVGAGGGGVTDHGNLNGLADDDHSQYVHNSSARTISAAHTFDPASPGVPFVLGSNAQGQTVVGLKADQLNKSVIAGAGLADGGALTSDVTLNIGAGDGIDVAADAISVDVTDLIDVGLDEDGSNNIILADSVAGAGLGIDAAKVISVGAGDGLMAAADSIYVGEGDGITVSSVTVSVDVTDLIGDGLVEEATNNIALGQPSTLTAITTDSVTALSHAHAITASDNPSDRQLLKSTTNGYLRLQRIGLGGIGTDPGYPLVVLGTTQLRYDEAKYALFSVDISSLLTITTTGTDHVLFTGNLGIGVSPDYPLHVIGNQRLQFDGTHFVDIYANSGGALFIDPSHSAMIVDGSILPVTNYERNIGSVSKKYLSLHVAELWSETLVAHEALATIGGRILLGHTTQLTSDLTDVATTIYVKHNSLSSGDRVVLEANGNVEFMSIDSAYSGTGPYSYTVTRNLDGSGGNAWWAGDAVFNTGSVGDGFIDLYSYSGVGTGSASGSPGKTNLIAWWELNETSGTRVDSHGSNDLADNATVLYDTGKQGNAADFELDFSEYLSIVDNADLSMGDIDFTLCAWVKHETLAGGGIRNAIVRKWDTSESEYLLDYHGSSSRYRFLVRNATDSGDATISANTFGVPSTATWYYVVAWHDATANTINIQINNGTVDSVGHSTGVNDSTSGFGIGCDSDGAASNRFDGLIDEVCVYKRVLTSDERTWLYNSGDGRAYADLSPIGPTIVGNVRNSTTYNDWTEHWAIGNLNGVYGYVADTFGVGLGEYGDDHIVIDATNGIRFRDASDNVVGQLTGAAWTIGLATTDHVSITGSGIQMKDNGVVRGDWQTDGDIFIGSDVSAPATTYFSIFAGAQTYNTESVAAGDMLIGDNSSSKANILWDKSAGELLFRGGQAATIKLNTAGFLESSFYRLDDQGIKLPASTSSLVLTNEDFDHQYGWFGTGENYSPQITRFNADLTNLMSNPYFDTDADVNWEIYAATGYPTLWEETIGYGDLGCLRTYIANYPSLFSQDYISSADGYDTIPAGYDNISLGFNYRIDYWGGATLAPPTIFIDFYTSGEVYVSGHEFLAIYQWPAESAVWQSFYGETTIPATAAKFRMRITPFGPGIPTGTGDGIMYVDDIMVYISDESANPSFIRLNDDRVDISDLVQVWGGLRVGDQGEATIPTQNDIRAIGDFAAGGGLYVGDEDGEPTANDIRAVGDIVAGAGMYVGSVGAEPGATGRLKVGESAWINSGLVVGDLTTSVTNDGIKAKGGLWAGTGLYVGNTSSGVVDNSILAEGAARVAGGVYAGSTGVAVSAGMVVGTSDFRCGGGLSVGSSTLDVGTGHINLTGMIFTSQSISCKVRRASTQSVNGGYTVVFTHENFDTYAMWSSGDPTKVYLKTPGVYFVALLCNWDPGTQMVLEQKITVNTVNQQSLWQEGTGYHGATNSSLVRVTNSTSYIRAEIYTAGARTLRNVYMSVFRVA